MGRFVVVGVMSWGKRSEWDFFTYGAESLIRICLHAEKTWLDLFVAEQGRVELDAHDLRLARRQRAFHLVLQVHALRVMVIFPSIHTLFNPPASTPVFWRTFELMERILADVTWPSTLPKCLT